MEFQNISGLNLPIRGKRANFLNFRQLFCLTITSLILVACAGNTGETIFRTPGPENSLQRQQISRASQNTLRAFLSSASLFDLRWPDFESHRIEIKSFYDALDGHLSWVEGSRPTIQAAKLIALFQHADRQGLRPDDYAFSELTTRAASLQSSSPEWDLVQFDLVLTVATIRYISDLRFGRVNPPQFQFDFDKQHKAIELASFVQQRLVNSQNPEAEIETLEPPYPAYHRTINALRNYLTLARRDDGQSLSLPLPQKPVRPGESYIGMPRLVKLLQISGDLPSGNNQNTLIYTASLSEAVRHFQSRHGVDANGLIDVPTVKQLNVPLARRIVQLQLALERWRWLPYEFERPPIVINIPEFRLHTNDRQYHWLLSMKVVVGKAYHHQTPVFASELKSVIFRPYWDVPLSIQRAELVPHFEQDSSYLSKHSYEIVDGMGNVIGENTTKAEGLRSGKLKIRQTPGPNNALGLIKFDFPNTHQVYMHGTPAAELFSRSRRDFSHGCIRVEDPAALAAWVLKDIPGWTDERIQSAMRGDKTVRVNFDKPIPVVIVYGTAIVMEDGEVRFFDDIYGLDAKLEGAIARLDSIRR